MSGAVVIFDLDGVLVDSEPYWREGFRSAVALIAADLGVPAPALSDEELHPYEGGRVSDTVRTLAAALFGDVSEETVDRAVDTAITRASSLFGKHPRPIEPSVIAAAELHRRGFRIGVASSSAPAFIETVVARLGLADTVEAMASAFFLANPKPHPDVYLNVLKEMDVAPERGTAIEDSWTGVQSALKAGLRTVWVTHEPVDSLKGRVQEVFPRDPEGGGEHPPLIILREVGADAVHEFSEGRP